MSLVGNLEDLGLGEILQIVSLSRKSGVLNLQGRGREGSITFLNGQVIQATSTVFRENLGDLLLRKGLVDIESLKQALTLQRQSDPPPRIGTILAEQFGLSLPTIDAIVKEQVEKIVYSFFGWTEGAFSFELGEPEEVGRTSFSPLQFMLEQGLNPQWLAMEGSRLLDEKRHRGESLEEQAEEPVYDTEQLLGELVAVAPQQPTPSEGESSPASCLLLVDDDELTREQFSAVLRERGYEVAAYSGGKEFLAAVESSVADGRSPVLLIDLIMPRLDGSGILGGYELLELLRSRFPSLPLLVFSDHPNAEAEQRVRRLGVAPVIAKPKKGDLRDGRGMQALLHLADAVDSRVDGHGQVPASPLYDIGAELLREMGESDQSAVRGKGQSSPGLHLLRGMLQELNNPALGGGIILLVLRFASELMNRAVVFLIKENEIVGLGQFGIEVSQELADVRVRRMKLPRDEMSVLSKVLTEMVPMKVCLGNSSWDDYIREQLGGAVPEQVFLGPIISEGKVVAILYGDNLPERKPIGDTEALEIFLSQAGLAMEKALLERRLRGRDAF